MASNVHVSIGQMLTRTGTGLAPVFASLLTAAPQLMSSSTTAAKSTVQGGTTASAIANQVWRIKNSGTDIIYVIFGAALTAGSYNTGNAATSTNSHMLLPGETLDIGVSVPDEQMVLIQAA